MSEECDLRKRLQEAQRRMSWLIEEQKNQTEMLALKQNTMESAVDLFHRCSAELAQAEEAFADLRTRLDTPFENEVETRLRQTFWKPWMGRILRLASTDIVDWIQDQLRTRKDRLNSSGQDTPLQ